MCRNLHAFFHTCTYIHECTHMHEHRHMHMCKHIHTGMYACAHTYTHTHTHECIYAHIQRHTAHMNMHEQACVHAHTCKYTQTRTQTHTHTNTMYTTCMHAHLQGHYTHTYTHTHTPPPHTHTHTEWYCHSQALKIISVHILCGKTLANDTQKQNVIPGPRAPTPWSAFHRSRLSTLRVFAWRQQGTKGNSQHVMKDSSVLQVGRVS